MSNESKEGFDLFRADDYGRSRAQDILTYLWRDIMRQRNLQPYEISDLMSRFLKDPRQMQIFMGKSLTSLRGNMRRALLKDHRMSWRWFERAINMIDPVKAKFIVELEWDDGEVTRHVMDLSVRDDRQLDLFEDMSDD